MTFEPQGSLPHVVIKSNEQLIYSILSFSVFMVNFNLRTSPMKLLAYVLAAANWKTFILVPTTILL